MTPTLPEGCLGALEFPPPAKLLNLNDRLSHHPKNKLVQLWKNSAYLHAVDAINRHVLRRGLPFTEVLVSLPVPSKRTRRDPHNYMATVKPIVDGLVRAGVWPDDTPDHVTVAEPKFHTREHDHRLIPGHSVGSDLVFVILRDPAA